MGIPASRVMTLLAKHPLLAGVSARAVEDLYSMGELLTFSPGQWLSREGDDASHYWLLLAGSAKVFYRSAEGGEVTVKLFGAPAAWAEMELLTDHPHIEDCVAVDRCTVLRIPKEAFSRFLDAQPRFMRNVLCDTCARFLIAAQNEKALAFQTVEQRLAGLLLAYLRMYGVPVAQGLEIRVPLSHESLASGIGAAKKSVTRALTRWKEERILTKRSRHFVVRDPERLAALSAGPRTGIDWVAGSRLPGAR